jgi:uncharacterized protein (TIGR00255 family)
MLKSMTGYGRDTVETDSFVLTVEVKSVNNRFLKITGRVPEELTCLQSQIEELIRKRLVRGSVYFNVAVEPRSRADLYEIDHGVLRKYLTALRESHEALNIDDKEQPSLRDLLLLPGVVRAEEGIKLGDDELLGAARKAMDNALTRLVDMRRQEGAFLEEDFRKRSETLRSLIRQVNTRTPAALIEYNQRLKERVNQLLADAEVNVSSSDLIREVAVVAERSDITEELSRMESHIQQFLETLHSDEPVGRKLEFIVQELFRESNTMGAKALSSELSRSVVEIKAEVDRLKEQVLNIE